MTSADDKPDPPDGAQAENLEAESVESMDGPRPPHEGTDAGPESPAGPVIFDPSADQDNDSVSPVVPSSAIDVFDDWLAAHRTALSAARDEAVTRVKRLLDGLGAAQRDLHIEQAPEEEASSRVKSLDRIVEKCRAKQVIDPGDLLKRAWRRPGSSEDARLEYPVGDLVGIRVLVRALSDVEMIRDAVVANGLGDADALIVDDKNERPAPSGYRALHVNGTVTFDQLQVPYTVPFELQVKTLAQHVFGQHTHDAAYVEDAVTGMPRFERVRGLQRAMADALNVADLMQLELERLMAEIREELLSDLNTPVTAYTVVALVESLYDEVLSLSEAESLFHRAEAAGLETLAQLKRLIDPGSESARRASAGLVPGTRRASLIVDQLLPRGTGPADLPVVAADAEAGQGEEGSDPPSEDLLDSSST